ncbi:hypothetical protein [Lactiplantibacillus fabifermentans]|uniref:Uncharacterized protein n=2 Tax=Lactiplantibacillus fabifermentans TaxID=483011 RepID=A0A0R2NU50_9LACO|nr:hypothetical protein [Lactiplantibacillus fabifermentans]ETY74783.1 hypothetical protein LFAB_05360 [Lactiplantibacillus fabifermentans T30PCM01]KRO29215.1 hypothetical protein DY78_GL001266 [Lactiplantibacillus fabifermentans DSM 21115]
MALFGFTIIILWLIYKFFTKWLWWALGFGIVINILAWFMKFGWLIVVMLILLVSVALFALAIRNYRHQH